MAWRTEKWSAEVFPGLDKIYSEYAHLPRRELAVIAAAVLDAALSEVLSKRFVDHAAEIEDFLGLDGDGRAPCAAFGAKIQIGLLTGVLTPTDAGILRAIKGIRNRFAHEVRADFTSKSVLPFVLSLHDQFGARGRVILDADLWPQQKQHLAAMLPHLKTAPEAGAGLLLAVLCVYQAYFYRLLDRTQRVYARPWNKKT
jgi:hypothetical protein